jgi:hypothetical protein
MTARRLTFSPGESPGDRVFGNYGHASVRVREKPETCIDFIESGLDSTRTRCLTNFVEIKPIFLATTVRWLLADPRVEAVIVDLI